MATTKTEQDLQLAILSHASSVFKDPAPSEVIYSENLSINGGHLSLKTRLTLLGVWQML